MITVPETIIYNVINEHLDALMDIDIQSTHNNIKFASIITAIYLQEQYDIVNSMVPISEEGFFDLITTYFTDQVASQLGRLFQALFVGSDLLVGSLASGASGISSFSVSMLTPLLGATGASIATGLGPLLILVLGFAFYKYIKTSDVRNVSIMVKTLNKMSRILKFNIDERINTEFQLLLKNKCISIADKQLKLQCAINGYIKYLNNYVLVILITKYVEFLKSNNEDLSDVITFNQLGRFSSRSNKDVSKLMNQFFHAYLLFLQQVSGNKSIIGDSFLLLNKATTNALRN